MAEQGQAVEQPFNAQDAIFNMLQKEGDGEPKPKEPAAEPAAEPVEPAEPAEPDAAEPAEPAEPEPTIEIDPEAKIWDVEITGEDGKKSVVKHSLKDLTSQRMMQADYQRKTAEIAREREGLGKKVQELTGPKIQEAEQAIQLANQVILELAGPELKGLDAMKMAQIARDDPAKYAELLGKQQWVGAIINQLTQKQQALNQQKQTDEKVRYQQSIKEAVEVLQRDIPGWNDQYLDKVLKGAEEFGFAREESSKFIDPRVIKVLDDARKYRELQKAKPGVEKKVVTVPKVLKPGTPSQADDSKAEKVTKLANRAIKSGGKTEDITQYLLARGI